MVEQKTAGETAPPSAEPAKAKASITKKEAVRRSLKKLGRDALPKDIQKDIKSRFAIDMSTDHISTTKGEIRRETNKSQAAEQPADSTPTAAHPVANAAGNGTTNTVAIEDILELKNLGHARRPRASEDAHRRNEPLSRPILLLSHCLALVLMSGISHHAPGEEMGRSLLVVFQPDSVPSGAALTSLVPSSETFLLTPR